jgi:hypothetical protein
MSTFQCSEASLFCRYILRSLDHLFQCIEKLNKEQLNWKPAIANANSLYVLAVHTLANAEENILYMLRGQESLRQREQEFLAYADSAENLLAYWQEARVRLQDALLEVTSEDLVREINHPRRGMATGLEILIIVARHAAEHLGQAELTRDLMNAYPSQGHS